MVIYYESCINFSYLFILVANDIEVHPTTLIFSSNRPEACFTVALIDDSIIEFREGFFVNLTSTDQAITLIPNYRIIEILDNDGKPT